MEHYLRYALVIIGAIMAILAVGFAFQLDWATNLWPWPDSRLTYIFLGSIAAAIAAPVLWLGITGELGAVQAGVVNIVAIGSGSMIYLSYLFFRRNESHLLAAVAVFGVIVAASIVLFIITRPLPLSDRRPMPRMVRVSFAVFASVLVAVAIALLFRVDHVFPWPLQDDTSVMIGWILLGASIYFGYALRRSYWKDATGQLIGFLAYDVVLLGPFLRHFDRVQLDHRVSLIIYTAVLIYSAGLATYYLFLNPSTRIWHHPTALPHGSGH